MQNTGGEDPGYNSPEAFIRNISCEPPQASARAVPLRRRDFYNAKGDALLRNDETIYRELPGALRRNLVRARYSPILTKIPFLRGASAALLLVLHRKPTCRVVHAAAAPAG